MTTPALGRDYRWFWVSAAASNLGDGVRLGALPLLALSLTDPEVLVAGVTAMTFLPWVVFGALGGVLVDRGNRRRLMLVGQVVRAGLSAGLAITLATDTATIGVVYVVAFGLGLGEVVVDSASQAAIPQLVAPSGLDRANSRLVAAQTVLDQVFGAALGSLLFVVAAPLPFLVDGTSFLVSAAALVRVRRPLQGARDGGATRPHPRPGPARTRPRAHRSPARRGSPGPPRRSRTPRS